MARYEELRYRLQLLVAEFPTLLTLRVLGSMRHHGKTYDVLRLELREAGGEEKVEVCLAFGTHGNEDLTAESVEEFLKSLLDPSSTNPLIDLPSTEERQRLRETFALTVYFFNPIGFDRTERSDGARHDLNRWFGRSRPPHPVQLVMNDLKNRRFDACIDLHGDITGTGFMVYERTRLPCPIAGEVIKALKAAGVHIVSDGGHEGDVVQGGVVSKPFFAHTLDDYLFFEKKVPLALTFEYPGRGEVAADIQSLVIALYAALTHIPCPTR